MKFRTSYATLSAIAASALLLAACAGRQTATTGNTRATSERVQVQTGTVENRIIATGRVAPKTTYNVAYSRSGTVVSKAIKEGDTLKAGQLIGELDTRDLRFTADQQYQNYLSAQASYSTTIKGGNAADLASAQASLNSAWQNYTELKKGPTAGSIEQALRSWNSAKNALWSSQLSRDKICGNPLTGKDGPDCKVADATVGSQYESERRAYQAYLDAQTPTTDDKLASAYSGIAAAQAKIESLKPTTENIAAAKAKMDQAWLAWQQAEENIKNARLVAPAAGLVTSVKFEIGDAVGANVAVVTLADFSEPVFEMDVDEADLGAVKVDQIARVQLQTYPNSPFPARVSSIAVAGTVSSNIVTYKVKLAVKPEDPSKPVLLSMSGTGEVVTGKAEGALLVPNKVLIIDSTTREYGVLKVNADNSTTRVPVKLGYRSGDNVQILSGLTGGEMLAVPAAVSATQNGGVPPPQ